MKNPNHSALAKRTTRNPLARLVRFGLGLMIIAAAVSFYSCSEEEPMEGLNVNNNLPYLDIARFEQNLEDYIKWGNDEPIGWGFVINKDGHPERWKAYGLARTKIDGEKSFVIGKKINVASVSKFYTAVAVMQLLEKNGLTINSYIGPFIPNSWVKGPGVNSLRFKDILRHESGLDSENTDFSNTLSYEGIKACIQKGVVKSKERTYLNVNYALCRVLIPSLWKQLPNGPQTDLNSDLETQNTYINYMQEYIFGPSGLADITCVPETRLNSTLYYNVNDETNITKGQYYGDWTAICGGGGFFMSLYEMAAVSAYYENTDHLLSDDAKNIMKENRIGMDQQDVSDELHGEYYSKNGSISNDFNQGVLTQIVHFPLNNVECVVVMNTQGVTFRNGASLRQLIFDAYNDAWVTP